MKIFALLFIISSLYSIFNQKRLISTFDSVKLKFYSRGIGLLYRHLDFFYYILSLVYLIFVIIGLFKNKIFLFPILFFGLLLYGRKTKLSTYQINIIYNILKIIFLTTYIIIG